MSTIACLFMHFYLVRENARRDRLMESKGLTLDTYTEDMRIAERDKGDNATVSSTLFVGGLRRHLTNMLYTVLPLHDLMDPTNLSLSSIVKPLCFNRRGRH
jgi:hypothetical protein